MELNSLLDLIDIRLLTLVGELDVVSAERFDNEELIHWRAPGHVVQDCFLCCGVLIFHTMSIKAIEGTIKLVLQ